jgi:tetratricopeptide (TPR) repeat protein
MSTTTRLRLLTLCLVLATAAPVFCAASGEMPITTSSAEARHLYLHGLDHYGNYLQIEKALQAWRASVGKDPRCAMSWAMIARISRDPKETQAARTHAKSLSPRVSKGEQLFIKWVTAVAEDNYLDGIAALNDLLAEYPGDKWILFNAGDWLVSQSAYRRAQPMFEKAYALDPKFPAVLNDLGYTYAHFRDYPKALDMLARYTATIPGEPNGEDSYAEILRLSGNFNGALEHYRKALRIDPKFHSSQVGLADTYALMGDEARARAEYEKAIAMAPSEPDRLDYSLRSAASFVRDKNYAAASKQYTAVALRAHRVENDLFEAQAHRAMALYQTDFPAALDHLEQAERALHHNAAMSGYDRQLELANILRTQVLLLTRNNRLADADRALAKLQDLSDSSHNDTVERSLHVALGASQLAHKQFADAISNLEEDPDDPFALELLARAQRAAGDTASAEAAENHLLNLNIATVEQAVVVLPARQSFHGQ